MQKRNIVLLYLFVFFIPTLAFSLTKKDILKTSAITGTNYYCLYYSDATKVGVKNKNNKYKTVSFSKVKKELNKEKNNNKQKMQKERSASKKKQYKKLFKMYDKAVALVEDCQTEEVKGLACQIHEFNGLNSKNKKDLSSDINKKIINGQTCNDEESRVARIYMYYEGSGNDYATCSGTLIAGNVILTAAHCLVPDEDWGWVNEIYVVIGGLVYRAIDYNFNVLYYYESEYGEADIGYVVLNTSLPYKPMPLVSKRATAPKGTIAAISGYGYANVGSKYFISSGDLRAGFATTEVTTSNSIVAKFKNEKSQSNICNGDSGGPLTIYENGEWRLFGVASSGTNICGLRGNATSYWSKINSDVNVAFLETYLGNIYSKK